MALKVNKLAGPRPVVLHNDPAYGAEEFKAPGAEPAREDVGTDEAHAVALAAYADTSKRWAAWMRYTETYDLAHLEQFLVAGAAPTIFMVQAMPADAQAALGDFVLPGGKLSFRGYLHAVRYGVTDIKGLELQVNDEPAGNVKIKRVDGECGPSLDGEALAIFQDHQVLFEIAMHVIAAPRLPKGLHKSG